MEDSTEFKPVAADGEHRKTFAIQPFPEFGISSEFAHFRRFFAGIFGKPFFCIEVAVKQVIKSNFLSGAQIKIKSVAFGFTFPRFGEREVAAKQGFRPAGYVVPAAGAQGIPGGRAGRLFLRSDGGFALIILEVVLTDCSLLF